MSPLSTFGPTGWSWNSKLVTMPKFPPPPRSPQKRSAFSVSLARTWLPSAVTTSAESRLSTVMPYFRLSQPKPPPSVRPATPVVELMPKRRGEAVRLRGRVEVGQRAARLDGRPCGLSGRPRRAS